MLVRGRSCVTKIRTPFGCGFTMVHHVGLPLPLARWMTENKRSSKLPGLINPLSCSVAILMAVRGLGLRSGMTQISGCCFQIQGGVKPEFRFRGSILSQAQSRRMSGSRTSVNFQKSPHIAGDPDSLSLASTTQRILPTAMIRKAALRIYRFFLFSRKNFFLECA